MNMARWPETIEQTQMQRWSKMERLPELLQRGQAGVGLLCVLVVLILQNSRF